jgi:hypothetical protein
MQLNAADFPQSIDALRSSCPQIFQRIDTLRSFSADGTPSFTYLRPGDAKWAGQNVVAFCGAYGSRNNVLILLTNGRVEEIPSVELRR